MKRAAAERIKRATIYTIGNFALCPPDIQECEMCHRLRPGRWLDTDDGSGEWFTCWKCEPPTDNERESL